jgi:hypothetical protein
MDIVSTAATGVGSEEVLLEGSGDKHAPRGSPYDVSPDGQRFLVNVWEGQETPRTLTVVINWIAALKK